MTIATARVRCGGRLHTIKISRGRIVLPDHPNLKEEQALVALGGDPPRCLQVLEAWRNYIAGTERIVRLPPALREAARAARATRVGRAAQAPQARPPSLKDRLAARVSTIALTELRRCDYRRSRSRWVGGEHFVTVSVGDPPHIAGESGKVWAANRRWPGTNSHIHARVPLGWYARVYRRGLARLLDPQGRAVFVVDVLGEDENGLIVLAGRQGRGFNIYPCRARTDGRRLKWME